MESAVSKHSLHIVTQVVEARITHLYVAVTCSTTGYSFRHDIGYGEGNIPRWWVAYIEYVYVAR